MITFFKFIICCLLLHCNYAARHPVSPCPNVFAFEGEPENDRWYGVISFTSLIKLAELKYEVQLDRRTDLLVSWDGEVQTDDNILYRVYNPNHIQRPRELVNATIMVKFNPAKGLPNIAKIIINGNIMCPTGEANYPSISTGIGLSGETSTERFDPSFNEGGPQGEFPNFDIRGSQSSGGNYGNNPTYGNINPSIGDANRPVNVPNYNNPQNFGSNNNQYAGANTPNYGYTKPNQNNFNSYDNQPISNQGNNRAPSWQNNQGINSQTGSNNGQPPYNYQQPIDTSLNSVNPPNSGPVVTTLTLPNSMQNRSNIDQIVQIIRNQLDQQNANSNNTLIVAVVPIGTSPPPQQQTQNVVLVTPETSSYLPQVYKTTSTTTASTVIAHTNIARTKPTTSTSTVKTIYRSNGTSNSSKRSGEREREED